MHFIAKCCTVAHVSDVAPKENAILASLYLGNDLCVLRCVHTYFVASFPGSPERELYTRGEPGIFYVA